MKLTISAFAFIICAVILSGCESAANSNANSNARNTNANATATPMPTPAKKTDPTREEYDKNRAEYEKDKGPSTIGQGINDSWLWFKTRTALATANDLRDSTINVDVVNDVITLKGTVKTAAQKTQAETVAKGIEGQKGVKNELKVSAGDSMANQAVNGNTNKK